MLDFDESQKWYLVNLGIKKDGLLLYMNIV